MVFRKLGSKLYVTPQRFSQVTVVDKKGIFRSSSVMGQAVVSLDNPKLLEREGVTEWYGLEEADEDSD